MRCTKLWPIAGFLLASGVVRLARADETVRKVPLYVSLEYQAPDECLSDQEFKAVVKKRLGRDPFIENAHNRVLAFVSHADGVLAGDIVWRDESGSTTGQRHFPATNHRCTQLVEAMAFALAVQIQLLELEVEPKQTSEGREQTNPSSAAPPPPAPPKASPEQRPSASNRPKQGQRAAAPFLGGGGGLAFGMSAHLVPVGRVFGGVRWATVSSELGLEMSPPGTSRRADGAGFSQWYLLGTVAGCALPAPWSVCALLKVGTVRVSGRDIDAPNASGTLLAQTGLRAGLNAHLSPRAAISLHAEGLVNLTRWSVALDQTSVWSSPPFAAASGLDFTVLFP